MGQVGIQHPARELSSFVPVDPIKDGWVMGIEIVNDPISVEPAWSGGGSAGVPGVCATRVRSLLAPLLEPERVGGSGVGGGRGRQVAGGRRQGGRRELSGSRAEGECMCGKDIRTRTFGRARFVPCYLVCL